MERSVQHRMVVGFVKLSDRRHRVEVARADGSRDVVELDSRSFLRHDLAHYIVEATLGLDGGVWGSIADGGSFDGGDLVGADMALAERLAGPIQTLMRVDAGIGQIRDTLERVAPEVAASHVAEQLHSEIRSLAGRWRSTPYGASMDLPWPPSDRAAAAADQPVGGTKGRRRR